MTLETFVILALATWRVAHLLVDETGPFEIFDWLRAQFGIRVSEEGEFYLREGSDNQIGKMLLCLQCTSMWVGLLFGVLYKLWPIFTFNLAVVLAFSALACVIDRYVEQE